MNEKANKANSIAGLLNRTITYKCKEVMVPLYTRQKKKRKTNNTVENLLNLCAICNFFCWE